MIVAHPLFPHAIGPPTFVLDVSVPLTWVVPVLATSYTQDVMSAMVRETAVVPACWVIGLTAAARDAESRGITTPAVTTTKLATLRNYPILLDDETDIRTRSDILPLARVHSLGVLDAACLELALRLSLPLATTDATLSRAATVARVPVLTP